MCYLFVQLPFNWTTLRFFFIGILLYFRCHLNYINVDGQKTTALIKYIYKYYVKQVQTTK